MSRNWGKFVLPSGNLLSALFALGAACVVLIASELMGLSPAAATEQTPQLTANGFTTTQSLRSSRRSLTVTAESPFAAPVSVRISFSGGIAVGAAPGARATRNRSNELRADLTPRSIAGGETATLTIALPTVATETVTARVTLMGALAGLAPGLSAATGDYKFAAETGAYEPLTATLQDNDLPPPGARPDQNHVYDLDIGFEFNFFGETYTTLRANTHGALTFRSEAELSDAAFANARRSHRLDDFTPTAPGLYPLWSRAAFAEGSEPTTVYANTSGTAPQRVFTYEARGARWHHAASGPVIDYQARLYESSGVIEFVYDTGNGVGAYVAPTGNLRGHIMIANSDSDYIILSDGTAGATASRDAGFVDRVFGPVNAAPADNQVFRFTPFRAIDAEIAVGATEARVDLTALADFLEKEETAAARVEVSALTAGYAVAEPASFALGLTATPIPLAATLSRNEISEGETATLTASRPTSDLGESVAVTVVLSGALGELVGFAGAETTVVLTLAVGQETVTYEFAAFDDTEPEETAAVGLRLSAPAIYELSQDQFELTIADDDPPIILTTALAPRAIVGGETATLTISAPADFPGGRSITVRATLTGDLADLEPLAGGFANEYRFEAERGVFAPLDASLAPLRPLRGDADDGSYGALDIGFEFEFFGAIETRVSAGANGALSFADEPELRFRGFDGIENVSKLAPALFPLWDDLDNASGEVRAATVGARGERVFVYEVLGAQWDSSAAAATVDYQARLYEGSGVIEFVYNAGADYVNPVGASATIGLANGGDEYITLSAASANPTALRDSFMADIAARPASGQIYRFVPFIPPVEFEFELTPDAPETSVVLTARGGEFLSVGETGTVQADVYAPRFGYDARPASLTLTITDDDVALRPTLSRHLIGEGETATLTVERPASADLSESVSVAVMLSGALGELTGFAGTDATVILTLDAGAGAAEYDFVAFDDFAAGETATVGLRLSAPSGYELTRDHFELTLTDDDPPLTLLATDLARATILEGETATLTARAPGTAPDAIKVAVTLTGDFEVLEHPAGATLNYEFEAETGVFTRLDARVEPILPSLRTALNDGYYRDLDIGFEFYFYGALHTRIHAGVNGLLHFNRPSIVDNQLAFNAVGNLDKAAPALFPLWDDLGADGTDVRVAVLGERGERVFVYEVLGAEWDFDTGGRPVIDYQVRLYEGTNIIEFVYNRGANYAAPVSPSATIGIASGRDEYIILSDESANPTASGDIFTDDIDARPASGQIYRFVPVSLDFELEIAAGAAETGAVLTARRSDLIQTGETATVNVMTAALDAGYMATPENLTLTIESDDPPIVWTPRFAPNFIFGGETATLTIGAPAPARETVTVQITLTGGFAGLEPIASESITGYAFEAAQGVFEPLDSGVATLGIVPFTGEGDEGSYGALDIGFGFEFFGAVESHVYANTDGLLLFGDDPFIQDRRTNAVNLFAFPALFPLWDDLDNSFAEARAATVGAVGERVFVFEVLGAEWYFNASASVIDYQVRLYEGTNIIEFVYNAEADYAAPLRPGATIGLAKDRAEYIALSDASPNPTALRDRFATDIDTRPASGQIYRFIPNSVTLGLEFELEIQVGALETSVVLTALDGFLGIDERATVNAAVSPLTFGHRARPSGLNLTLLGPPPIELTPTLSRAEIGEGETTALTVSRPLDRDVSETLTIEVVLSGAYGDLGLTRETFAVSIAANAARSAPVELRAVDDLAFEETETARLAFRKVEDHVFVPASLDLTILDNDVLLTASASGATADEGEAIVFTVRRASGAVALTLGETVSVEVALSGDGVDDLVGGGETRALTIGAGVLYETFALTAQDDDIGKSSGGAVFARFASLTPSFVFADDFDGFLFAITDNDSVRLTADLARTAIVEGEATTLTLSRSALGDLSESVVIAVVFAGAYGDLGLADETAAIYIAAGETRSAPLDLRTVDDAAVEETKTARLSFVAIEGHVFVPPSLDLTIADNDALLAATSSTLTIDEGESVVFVIRRESGAIDLTLGEAVSVEVELSGSGVDDLVDGRETRTVTIAAAERSAELGQS